MSDAALLLIALMTAIFGMASMALSISAHWRQLFPQRTQSAVMRIVLRLAGAGLIAAALLVCMAADPFTMAILVWPMLLMIGAGVVAAVLTLHGQMRGAASAADDRRRAPLGGFRRGCRQCIECLRKQSAKL